MASKAKRTLVALLSVLLAVVLMIGLLPQGLKAGAQAQDEATQEQPAANEQTLDIAVLSDIHILPSDLIADTEDYQDALNSDRKIFTESTGILDRMLAEVVEQAPDVLMISGDLTKDGELESHQYVASKLAELKKDLPDIKIYVTNGNHDVNNDLAYNYNTENGDKEPATRTTPELFLETYADTVYNAENGVVAQFKPSTYTEEENGDKAGMLSYVAEPAEGYTIIVVDSGRYSADNTDEGTAEHQTSGQISDELKNWVIEQAQAAEEKGNTVIGMMHHGLIEHFGMEEEFLADYLVNDYQDISAAFADAGIHYVFTGHMHANDIAAMTTAAGNELYDIETGSAVTYPCPMRFVTFTSKTEGEKRTISADIDTVINLDNITYLTADKQETTIEDLTEYAKQPQFGLSENVIVNVGAGVVDGLLDTVQESGVEALLTQLFALLGMEASSLNEAVDALVASVPAKPADETVAAETTFWKDGNGDLYVNMAGGATISVVGLKESLAFLVDELDRLIAERTAADAAIEQAIRAILATVVYEGETSEEDKTLIQLVNDVYQSHLSGDDNGMRPAYIDTVVTGLNDGTLLPVLVQGIVEALWDAVVELSGEISLKEFTGMGEIKLIKEDDSISAYDPQPMDGRTQPLIVINEDNTSGVLNLLFALVLGSKMDKYDTYWEINEAATVKDLLGNSLLGLVLDIPEMLYELLMGTPATDEAPAEDGVLTPELQKTLSGLLSSVIGSMSEDSNYAEDADTVITVVTGTAETKTVTAVAVTEFETEYRVGDEFTGGKLMLVYNDGTTEEVEITRGMASGFNTSSEGEKTVTITYKGMTDTVAIDVVDKHVSGIVVKEFKTEYMYGDAVEGTLTVVYDDGSTEDVEITRSMASGFSTYSEGENKTATIEYAGFEQEVTYSVQKFRISEMYVQGFDIDYEIGETFAGAKLLVKYNDGSSETVDITAEMLSGFDTATAGEKQVTVSYQGEAAETVSVTVDINVAAAPEVPAPTVSSIAVIDFDLDYTVNDVLSGGKVLVIYSDGTTQTVDIAADMLSGFDTTAEGKKTVTVTYEGKTATVEIEVVAAAETSANGDNNAAGGNSDSQGDKGCGSAIALGTSSAIAGMLLLAACSVIAVRKRCAGK